MSIRGAFSQNNLSTEGLGGDDLYTELWRACAGPLVDVPRIQERVLYFPQGRMEQLEASTNQELNQRIPLFNLPSKILCRVVNFHLRAEQYTNEVYAQITLLPEPDQTEPKIPDSCPPELPRPTIYSFCKVLMASDTSTHGGFWVLRKHANECLPSLVNESADTNPRINIQGSSQFGMAVQAYFSRPTQEAFAYDRMEHISYFQKISYWGYFCLSEIFGGEWEFTCRCQAYLLANRATC